jgi:hypothetical protein
MSGEVPPYPRPGPEGRPEPTGWRRWARAAVVPLTIVTGIATAAVLALGLLWAFNPMGDEWVCSEGEAPAGAGGPGSACYRRDQPLPDGLHWDPLGNRPMPYNCDKDGWTPIARDRDDARECLNDDLPMPRGWHAVD